MISRLGRASAAGGRACCSRRVARLHSASAECPSSRKRALCWRCSVSSNGLASWESYRVQPPGAKPRPEPPIIRRPATKVLKSRTLRSRLRSIETTTSALAEGEGFEPSVGGLPLQRFSRPPRSTTPAPLRGAATCGRSSIEVGGAMGAGVEARSPVHPEEEPGRCRSGRAMPRRALLGRSVRDRRFTPRSRHAGGRSPGRAARGLDRRADGAPRRAAQRRDPKNAVSSAAQSAASSPPATAGR